MPGATTTMRAQAHRRTLHVYTSPTPRSQMRPTTLTCASLGHFFESAYRVTRLSDWNDLESHNGSADRSSSCPCAHFLAPWPLGWVFTRASPAPSVHERSEQQVPPLLAPLSHAVEPIAEEGDAELADDAEMDVVESALKQQWKQHELHVETLPDQFWGAGMDVVFCAHPASRSVAGVVRVHMVYRQRHGA